MKSLLSLLNEYKVKLDDIAEELVYRTKMRIYYRNYWECRKICNKYKSMEVITNLEKTILKNIEKSIAEGQLLAEEKADYKEIGNIIIQRYRDILDEFDTQAKLLSMNGYTDDWAASNHRKDNVPTKIPSLNSFITDCRKNFGNTSTQRMKKIEEINTKINDKLLQEHKRLV